LKNINVIIYKKGEDLVMPLDGIVFNKIIREIRTALDNYKLRNAYQPVNNQILLQFKSEFILFSLSNPAYISLLENKPDIPDNPLNFAQLLRKNIKGMFLKDAQQIKTDRAGYLLFEGTDYIGQEKTYKLYFELMGRNSNLILTKEDEEIIDSWKKMNDDRRTILPGAVYKPFYDDKKKTIFDDFDDIKNVMGLASKSKRFIYEIGKEKAKEDMNNEYIFLFHDENGNPDISAITPNDYDFEELTPSKAIDKLFSERANKSRYLELKNVLEKKLRKTIEKKENLKAKLLADIEKQKDIPDLIKKGELLQTYLYQAKKGDEFIEVYDWENDKNVIIKLDPLTSPSTNLEKYFNKVDKLKKRVLHSKKRLIKIQKELDYYYQLSSTVDTSDDLNILEEIREEMIDEGIIQVNKKKRRKKPKSTFKKFEYKGFEILVGRNNKQNDDLTKSASKDDIWLHTHEIPGSHVLIKGAGKEIPEDVIKRAAEIEAYNSRAKMSNNVPVDYTTPKYVWKPKGAKPGMWLYENFSTIFVTPKQ
jgi:predicted ribosome quality control (RQC) complex YloA/Tae2 family protein